MYAIIEDGGRQHKVQNDLRLLIDYNKKLQPGDTIEFERILALCDGENVKIGQPIVSGAKVLAEVIDVKKGPKLTICWLRKRKNSRRKTGHRQKYTYIKVTQIVTS